MSGTVQKCGLCPWSVYDPAEGEKVFTRLQDPWLIHMLLAHPRDWGAIRPDVQGVRPLGANVWLAADVADEPGHVRILARCALCGPEETPWYADPDSVVEAVTEHYSLKHGGQVIRPYGSAIALAYARGSVGNSAYWSEGYANPPVEGEATSVEDQPKLDGIRGAIEATQRFALALIPVAEQLSRLAGDLTRDVQEALRKPPSGG